MSTRGKTPLRYSVESLEPRLLLAADWAAVLAPPWSPDADHWSSDEFADWLPAAANSTSDAIPSPGAFDLMALRDLQLGQEPQDFSIAANPANDTLQASRHELVVVDAGVDGYEALLADLTGGGDDVQYEIHLLEAGVNGVQALSALLAGFDDLDAVHLVSHGDAGGIQLGDTWLDASSVDQYADAIGGWSAALADDADLLIYGCNLAGNADGLGLVDTLAALTGADVAASTDTTGQASLGGDWNFEYRAGDIQTGVAFSAQLQASWSGVLAAFIVDTDNDTVDVNPGDGVALDAAGNTSLRAAIMEANALPGADFIQLPSGDYQLSIPYGAGSPAATGDLDITDDLTLVGDDSASTFIDANQLSRVFDIGNGATVTLSGITVLDGGNETAGGGINVQAGAKLFLFEATVRDNAQSIGDGGGIYNAGIAILSDVTLSGNTVVGDGGGFYNSGEATLFSVTINDNNSARGGGLFQASTATGELLITNATISANGSDFGGGIFTQQTTTIENSTITLNTAGFGGGIMKEAGAYSVSIGSSIVQGNTGTVSDDVSGTLTSLGYNLIGKSSGTNGFTDGVNNDQVGSVALPLDAMLGSLQDNGGYVFTHALLAASPAINMGNPASPLAYDARVAVRDAAPDAGAYEFGAVLNNTPSATNLSQSLNYQEDVGSVPIADIVVTEADSGDVITATLTLADPATGTLTATSGNGELYAAGTGIWSVTGTVAAVNAALANVAFRPASDNALDTYITTRIEDASGHGPPVGLISLDATGVNDAPSFVMLGDQSVVETTTTQSVAGFATAMAGGGVDESGQTFTYQVSNDNPALFDVAPAIDASGTLTYTLNADVTGTVTVSVFVVDSGGTANGGKDWSLTQDFEITVVANTSGPALLFSTVGNASGVGPPGLDGWEDHHVIAFGDPGFSFGTGASTTGEFALQFVLGDFGDDMNVNGMHFVNSSVMMGSGAGQFLLKTGDLLLTFNGIGDHTYTGMTTAITVQESDVFVFRPRAPGDYSDGEFYYLLDNPLNDNVRGIALLESASVTIGDGPALVQGTLLLSEKDPGDHDNIYTYLPQTVGNGTTTSVLGKQLLIDGEDSGGLNFIDQIQGIHVIEAPTVIGGVAFLAGDLLLTLNQDQINPLDGVGSTNLEVYENDIFRLRLSETQQGPNGQSVGVADIIFDGSNVGLDVPQEDLDALTLVFSNGNTPPAGTNLTQVQNYTEDVASVALDDIVVTDGNAGDTITAMLILADVDTGLLTTGSGNGEVYDAGSGKWVVTGSIAQVNAALAAVAFTPAANNAVSTSISTHIEDAGGLGPADGIITLNVTAVNDAPSFTTGGNQSVLVGSGPQTVAGFASAMAGGGADESGQTFSYQVSNDNAGLFDVAPAIDASGTLTYTLRANVTGTVTVTVSVVDSGGTANGGEDTSPDQTFDITVLADVSGSLLLLSTEGDVSSLGPPGLDEWDDNHVVAFGDPGFSFGPDAATSGEFTLIFELGNFGDNRNVNGMHFVNSGVTVGTGAGEFVLQSGDLLLTFDGGGDNTYTGMTTSITVQESDVFVFRPRASGDYSNGEFYYLLDNPLNDNVMGIALVESASVTIGDGPALVQGTFLLGEEDTGEHDNIYTYLPQTVGDGGTSSVLGAQLLIDGEDTGGLNFTDEIQGIHLIEAPTVIGGVSFLAGDLLLTLNKDQLNPSDGIGTTNLEVYQNDVFRLRLSETQQGPNGRSVGVADMLFDGSSVGLTGGAEDLDALTLVYDTGNTPPAGTNLSQVQNYTEDAASVALDDIVVTDGNAGNTITAVLTLADIATGLLTTGSGNGETYDAGTGIWTVTGSIAQVNAALAAVAFTPAANNAVSTSITTHIEDAGGLGPADGNITLNVTAVNDAPSFTTGGDQSVLEDSGPYTVAGFATALPGGGSDEAGQTFTYSVVADNPGLFAVGPMIDASGTLTYTLNANATGTARITVSVTDSGGTADGGDDSSADQFFDIIVAPVNDAPVLTIGGDQSVLEDSGPHTVVGFASALPGGGSDEAGQTFTYSVVADNTGLFAVGPAIDASGTLTYTLAANASGTASIKVSVTDSGGTANGGTETSPDQLFEISVAANTVVTTLLISTSDEVEDVGPPGLDEWEDYHVLAFGDPGFSFGPGASTAGEFSLAFDLDNFGVDANLNGMHFVNSSLTIGSGAGAFTLQAGDLLLTTAGNGNHTYTGTTTSITARGSDVFVFRPDMPGDYSAGEFYYLLDDPAGAVINGISLVESASVTIGDGPALTQGTLLFSRQAGGLHHNIYTYVPLTVGDGDTSSTLGAQLLIDGDDTGGLNISESIQGIQVIEAPTVIGGISFLAGDLLLTLGDDEAAVGSTGLEVDENDIFRLRLSETQQGPNGQSVGFADIIFDGSSVGLDDDEEGLDALTLAYSDGSNTPPAATNLSQTQSYTEDAASVALDDIVVTDGIAGDTITAALTLADVGTGLLTTSSGNGETYDAGTGIWTVTGRIAQVNAALAAVTFVPAADSAVGTSIATHIEDAGGLGPVDGIITLNVTAVNDAPSFTTGGNQNVLEDSGPHTVAGFAAALPGGGSDEAGQTFTYFVVADNPGLFAVGPMIDASGTLTYTLNANASGTARITVSVTDSGGTDNGGVNTSADQFFDIVVAPVNDAPTLAIGGNQNVLEDSGPHTVAGFAAALPGGGSDEAGQTLTYTVVANNPGLFAVGPKIDASGTLTYTLNANASGSARITVSLTDSGGTANGGVETAPNQFFDIVVTPVSDAPMGGNAVVNTFENIPYVFSTADFRFADPADGDTFMAVQIVSLPAGFGALTSNGRPVAAGDFVDVATIASGGLVFSPQGSPAATGDASLTSFTSFSFRVQDSGGTDMGGSNIDAQPNVISISVLARPGAAPSVLAAQDATPAADDLPAPSEASVSAPEALSLLDQQPATQDVVESVFVEAPVVPPVELLAIDQETLVPQALFNALDNSGRDAADSRPERAVVAVPELDRWEAQLTLETDASGRPTYTVVDAGTALGLEQMRDNIKEEIEIRRFEVGQTTGAVIGLSVGYVSWLLRGGVLLSSVLSSVPTWRFIDPLPVFPSVGGRDDDDEDDESLEGIVQAGAGGATAKSSSVPETTPGALQSEADAPDRLGNDNAGSMT